MATETQSNTDASTAPASVPPSASASAAVRPYRLSVRQYLRMIEAGVFPGSARVELLGGFLVRHMTKGNSHDGSLWALGRQLGNLLSPAWILREEKSLELTPRSRLEPDLVIVPAPGRQYFARAPSAREAALIVEVADTSYRYDRGRKWRRYAAAQVPVYWIVHLKKRQVEVYRDPTGTGTEAAYQSTEIYHEADTAPVVIAGAEVGRIVVREILP